MTPKPAFSVSRSTRFAAAAIALIALASATLVCQEAAPPAAWTQRFEAVDQQLRRGDWETARQAARTLTDQLAERGGGTLGDHRDTADQLGGAMANANPRFEALALGQAAALLALAEAGSGDRDTARWHWYLAQNLSPDVRAMDLSGYGAAGAFLAAHRLEPAPALHDSLVDVLDPVRPEHKPHGKFQEPVRTAVVYPRRPKDLSGRDRFSHVVFIQITVDAAGQVVQPVVVDAGFYPGLIYRAFDALRGWRYEPARLEGKPVPFRYVVPVVFSDDGPRPPERPKTAAIGDGALSAPLTAQPAGAPSAAPSAVSPDASDSVKRASGLVADAARGLLYLTDQARHAVLRVNADGSIRRVGGIDRAGVNGGFNGDGLPAAETQFNRPAGLSLDPRTDELFVADTDNYRVRVISPIDGRVRTVAGSGLRGVDAGKVPYISRTPEGVAIGRFSGDGGPATEAELNLPTGVCADPFGMLFIADSGNHRVRVVNRGTSPVFMMGVEVGPGEIRTIAGTGTLGFSGDGGKALDAQLAFPGELHVDASGNLIVIDTFNQRIRRIDRQSGIIRTIVRGSIAEVTPQRAFTSWSISIAGAAITPSQDLIYSDRVGQAIHRLTRAGDDVILYTASLHDVELASLDVGAAGDIFIADLRGHRIVRLRDREAATYAGGAPLGTTPILSPPPIRSGAKVASSSRNE